MRNDIAQPRNIFQRVIAWLTTGKDWEPYPHGDSLKMRRRNGNIIEYRDATAEEEEDARNWQANR